MRKKISIIILLIVLLLSICTKVKAADDNIFSITDAEGSKDDEVTLYINLDKELEFASADLVLEYDTSKLEYVKYTELDIFKESAMNIVKNNSDTGKIAIGYVSNPNSQDLNKSPGQMLSITFKIKSNISEVVSVNLKCTSLKNDAGESIQVDDAQSKITIATNNSDEQNENQDKNNTDGKNVEKTKENTSKQVLPYAGKGVGIVIMLFTILIISYYFYRKNKYLNIN